MIPGADAQTWSAHARLARRMPACPIENLILEFSATDDLGNTSTRIIPPSQFEVYQGELPGLGAPFGPTATPMPGARSD
ncbi:MAG: hypothetical protein R3F11_18440 [Verrucomicrobiales bacterium]